MNELKKLIVVYPGPSDSVNISWLGNWGWRSFRISSSHLGSPGCSSNSSKMLSCVQKNEILTQKTPKQKIIYWPFILAHEVIATAQILPSPGSNTTGHTFPALVPHLHHTQKQQLITLIYSSSVNANVSCKNLFVLVLQELVPFFEHLEPLLQCNSK